MMDTQWPSYDDDDPGWDFDDDDPGDYFQDTPSTLSSTPRASSSLQSSTLVSGTILQPETDHRRQSFMAQALIDGQSVAASDASTDFPSRLVIPPPATDSSPIPGILYRLSCPFRQSRHSGVSFLTFDAPSDPPFYHPH